MLRIFVSYRRADSRDIAGRIHDALVQHFPDENVFFDVDSIPPGVDFRRVLRKAVRQCQVVLVIIGPAWLTAKGPNGRRLDDPDDFVRIEVELALERNIPVIPVLVSDARMPRPEELPASIRELAFREARVMRSDSDFRHHMGRLLRALDRLDGKVEKAERPHLSRLLQAQEAWDVARRIGTVAAYEAFLADWPEAPQAEDARRCIAEQREEHAWNKTMQARTAEAYEAFLADWPDGRRAEEARQAACPLLRQLLLADSENEELRERYLAVRTEEWRRRDRALFSRHALYSLVSKTIWSGLLVGAVTAGMMYGLFWCMASLRWLVVPAASEERRYLSLFFDHSLWIYWGLTAVIGVVTTVQETQSFRKQCDENGPSW